MPCHVSSTMDDYNEVSSKHFALTQAIPKKTNIDVIVPPLVLYENDQTSVLFNTEKNQYDIPPLAPRLQYDSDDDNTTTVTESTVDETISEDSIKVTKENLDNYLHSLIDNINSANQRRDHITDMIHCRRTEKTPTILNRNSNNKIASIMNMSQKCIINAVEDAKIKYDINKRRQANIPDNIFKSGCCFHMPMFFGRKK